MHGGAPLTLRVLGKRRVSGGRAKDGPAAGDIIFPGVAGGAGGAGLAGVVRSGGDSGCFVLGKIRQGGEGGEGELFDLAAGVSQAVELDELSLGL